MSRLSLILLVILCFTNVEATWKVDQRCATQPAARRLRRNDDPAPGGMAHVKHKPPQYKQENSLSLTRNLRGIKETPRRQLVEDGLVEAFRLKMYWQEGYCWQEEWNERKWCMSCHGGTCNEGDDLWIQQCSDEVIQLFTWEPVAGTGGGKLKPFTHQGLCLEHVNTTAKPTFLYELRACNDTNFDTQIITGLTKNDPFELYPFGKSVLWCFSNGHHPKPKEPIFMQRCGNTRMDHTNFWQVYEPIQATPPTNIPLAPWETCHPGSLLFKNNITESGHDPFYNADFDAQLIQQDNGNLVVRVGDDVVWESGVNEKVGSYFTKLQGNGNLVTYYNDTEVGDKSAVWSSGEKGVSSLDYFLGLDCHDNKTVSIYEYVPTDPGRVIWTSGVMPTTLPLPSIDLFQTDTTLSQNPVVPFNLSALEYTDFHDVDWEHRGNCASGPVDATTIDDQWCHERGSQCAIMKTRQGEWLEYIFETTTDVTVDVSLRIASTRTDRTIRVEIDSYEGYGQVRGPGKGWSTYQLTHAFWGLPLSTGIHRMKVSFVEGQINLCSISVTTSSVTSSASTFSVTDEEDSLLEPEHEGIDSSLVDDSSAIPSEAETPTSTISTPDTTTNALVATEEPKATISTVDTTPTIITTESISNVYTPPFDIGALEYKSFIEHTSHAMGDCGSGPVDSEFTNDTICHDRGSICSVGYTEKGEMLEYSFTLEQEASVDILLRIADANSRHLSVIMPGVEEYALLTGPGRGWHEFQDAMAFENLLLSAGEHRLRVYFISGHMNLCTISVRPSLLLS